MFTRVARLLIRTPVAQVRTFARKKPSISRAAVTSGTGRAPPPPAATAQDPWEAVTVPEGTYYWNTVTNETTAIGAPRPAAVGAVAAQEATGPGGGGLMGVVAEGMAFGVGSSIARHAVGAIAGSFGGESDGGDLGGGDTGNDDWGPGFVDEDNNSGDDGWGDEF